MYISIEIIQNLESILQLQFVNEEVDNNVCFAGSTDADIRPEYRQVFTFRDVELYLKGIKYTHTSTLPFPYPQNADEFWKIISAEE